MKNKRIFKWLPAVLFSLLTFVTIVLCTASDERINVTIKSLSDDNYLNFLKVGETRYRVIELAKHYDLESFDNDTEEFDDDIVLLKKGEEINFSVSKFHNLGIYFDDDKSKGTILIKYGNKQHKINFKNKNVNSKYILNTSLYDIFKKEISNYNLFVIGLIIISFSCLYYFLISKIVNIFIFLKTKKDFKIRNIVLLFIIYFLISILCMLPLVEVLHSFYSFVVVIQLAFIIYYFRDELKKTLHNIFPLFAIIVSVNMAILIPPFHVPDEFSHFCKAYSLFHKEDIIYDDGYILKFNDNIYETINKYNFDTHNPNYRITIKEYFVDSTIFAKGKKEHTAYGFNNTATLNSFAYIASSLIIEVALLLKLPFMFAVLLGRIINSLIFIICGYLALKIIPHFKRAMFLMLLFPITIQQTAAINQDSITLSIVFLLVSIILKEIYDKDKKIKNSSIIIIFVLSLFLGMCKPGYFLISAMTMLIPKERFKSKKQCLLVKYLPVLLCFLMSLDKFLGVGVIESKKPIKELVSIKYAITHPIYVIRICINTFIFRCSLDLMTGHLNLFGWSTVFYDGIYAFVIYYLYLIMLGFNNQEDTKISVKFRIVTVIIAILTMGIIYASAMIGFRMTFITSDMISGLQSRYFIPVTILLVISLSNNFLEIKFKNKNLLAVLLVTLTFFVSFYVIINQFTI